MIAFKIIEPNIKSFMNALLREETFDEYEVRGVELSCLAKFEINGLMDKDFLPDSLSEKSAQPDADSNAAGLIERLYCTWKEIKPYVLNIIRGAKRPKHMKIVFSLPIDKMRTIDDNASALFLNITFSGEEILCTTAVSEKNFTMNKSLDFAWDEYIQKFIEYNKFIISTPE